MKIFLAGNPPGQTENRTGTQNRLLCFIPLAAGSFSALLGVTALAGWILNLPLLASFRAGLMPMAPGTAVLFVLYGTAVGWCSISPAGRRTDRLTAAMVGAGALAAFFILVSRCLSRHWPVERIGLNITGEVDGAPVGYMSLVAAFYFLLATASFLASRKPFRLRSGRALLAFSASGILLFACFIFLMAYLFGTPFLYGGDFIPPAVNTILAFISLGVGLLTLNSRAAGLFDKSKIIGAKTAFNFILIFALLTAFIVAIGYSYYRSYEKSYRASVESNLMSIVTLKVDGLSKWRKERLGDGNVFFNNPVFSRLVRRLLEYPDDADVYLQLQSWLGKTRSSYQYKRVFLVDTHAVIRVQIPEAANVDTNTAPYLVPAVSSRQVEFMGFHRHAPDQSIVLGVQVPVLDEADTNRLLGMLVLEIDPAEYLYPFIQRWPLNSETAETLLVRKEGDDVLFLNELRFQKDAALTLRYSLRNTDLPAAQAVLGHQGVVDGLDYRNVPVLAAVKAVPDSPWFMVARQDKVEAYAPLWSRLWQVVGMVGGLVFGAASLTGLIWRHQRVRFFKEKAATAEALRQTNDYLENLINHANAPIVVWDSQLHITRFNHAAERLTGRSEAEVLGQSVEVLLPPERIGKTMELISSTQIGGRWEEAEIPIRHVDGSIRTVLWNSATLVAPNETAPVATIAQGHDITERKRAEELILRNEMRLNGLVKILQSHAGTMQEFLDQALGEALCVTESRFGYIYFYDETTREFTLNTWSKDVMAECAVANPQTCYELDKTGIWGEAVRQRRPIVLNDFQSENPLRKGYPKGHVELTRFATIPVLKEGRIVAVVGVANKPSDYDETDLFQLTLLMDTVWKSVEIRLTQEELDQTSAILRTAMEQSPAGIAIAEAPSGKLTYVNQAGLEIVGGSARELVENIGMDEYVARWNLLDLDGSPLSVEQIPLVRVLQSGEIASREFIIRRGENDDRIVLAKAAPIKNAQGKTTSAVVVFVDVTENRRSERKLVETLENLRVSNRDLEQFAYVASHDLQEPLRMVSNYMQLLERRYKDRLDQDAHDFIGYAVDGAVRMRQLIDSLLEYSRLQTRKRPFEPVDLNQVLKQVLRDLEGRILEAGVQVTSDPLPQVTGDPVQLGLVFQNLISNAVKFRSQIGPQVHITAEESSRHWKVIVRDNGIGIEPEYQERIFKIFQRLHSRADYPGTGIGLAICRRIIERHGGETGVESALGKGSSFWVTLPRKGAK